ncbi:MAG TPA: hypothetical protein VG273_06905 [Bryobacteraceae bacterium]|jgi:uncharacterized protein (TIGR03437 family)|nr:hypothetical protein [Bryobacteraceae bacterium]
MKTALFALLLWGVSLSPAYAIVTLGLSTQNFIQTGIGQGQSSVGFGACSFDGTNTTCTLSGPFTGLGPGGTYSFVISYAGNGGFPLNALYQTPGVNDFVFQANSNYNSTFSFALNLAETNGPTITFYSFANFRFLYSTTTCTGVAAGSCAESQVAVTPGATITGQVTGTFDPTPSITPAGANTAAAYGSYSAIAPGTWMEIYGVNLVTNTRTATWANSFTGNQAPSTLAGTTVTIAGLPAYIDYVSPAQVNVLVPSGIPTGSQQIVVTTAGGTSTGYTTTINPIEPGVLAPLSFMINGAQNVVAVFSNTTIYVLPNSIAGVATAVAKPGDYITMYGIGFGPVTPNLTAGQLVEVSNSLPASLGITFAGVSGTIQYAGLAPGYTGLYQFNVQVPNVGPSNSVPVVFSLGGVKIAQQNLVIAIGQ